MNSIHWSRIKCSIKGIHHWLEMEMLMWKMKRTGVGTVWIRAHSGAELPLPGAVRSRKRNSWRRDRSGTLGTDDNSSQFWWNWLPLLRKASAGPWWEGAARSRAQACPNLLGGPQLPNLGNQSTAPGLSSLLHLQPRSSFVREQKDDLPTLQFLPSPTDLPPCFTILNIWGKWGRTFLLSYILMCPSMLMPQIFPNEQNLCSILRTHIWFQFHQNWLDSFRRRRVY